MIKKLVVFIFTILLVSIHCYSQSNGNNTLEKGNLLYNKKQYAQAIVEFEKFLHRSNDFDATYKLANSYARTSNEKKAIQLLKEISSNDNFKDTMQLELAYLLKKNTLYEEAKSIYQKLYSNYPSKQHYLLYSNSCDSAIVYSSRLDNHYLVQPLVEINTPYSEITPVLFKKELVFSSNREDVYIRKKSSGIQLPYFDLYSAKEKDSIHFYSPKPFSSVLNSIHHECCASFTEDNKKIVYTRSIDKQPGDGQKAINTLKMFSATWENNTWKEPHAFRFNDSTHSYGHPTVEANEELFFFASDKAGGFGGTDLYVCFNIDQKWTDPINLGPSVNSPYNELYPFYHPDGTLYFSSNRPEGIGGFDVYKTIENEQGDFTEPVNLKAPINSAQDDFSIFWTKTYSYGFLSSNRWGGKGQEDLFLILPAVLKK